MGPKQQMDKSAWQWAETTDPDTITDEHIEKAYRLGLKPCKPDKNRRNCKGNPHCLVGLGEQGWFIEIDDKYWYDVEDPSRECRKEGELAGLRNLGATCYLNILLQLWFHNLTLRSAILKLEEPLNISANQEILDELPLDQQAEAVMPTTACGHLQLIFALLQHSKRRHIDPTPFINCLGLDAAEQQDAQEFSKLFMSLLEDTLQHQQDPDIRNLVQRQFTGVYNYVTICSACGNGSKHSATFYELDLNIKGHKDLYECIDEFIKEERLEADNKYMCPTCNSKQDAIRHIQIQSLPPVLNVQLLRFVFDRASGVKKKLNTYIQFPEVLDMSQYLGEKKGTTVYDLFAVLIHRGPSAYSGHYVAHIRDQSTDVWYKFDDEEIEKMGINNLTLAKENELDFGPQKVEKKPKTRKGAHCSRNAYMLVYCLRKDSNQAAEVPGFDSLPPRLQKCLQIDNLRFEAWIRDIEKIRDENVARGHARQADVKEIYPMLPATSVDEMEWIPTKWIKAWLGGDGKGKVPEMDTTSLLCHHHRMDPDKVNMAKCISTKAGDLIFKKFKGKCRLKGKESLCYQCVSERCFAIRKRARINSDSKFIAQLLKSRSNQTSENSDYWVGKQSLKSWKKLALKGMEEKHQLHESDSSCCISEAQSTSTTVDKSDDMNKSHSTSDRVSNAQSTSDVAEEQQSTSDSVSKSQSTSDTSDEASGTQIAKDNRCNSAYEADKITDDCDDDMELRFNEDILCEEHGNLAVDTSCRRLVPDNIWMRLKSYFPEAPEFPAQTEPCYKCKMEREKEQEIKASLKMLALEQKTLLRDLYVNIKRAAWSDRTTALWVITKQFLDDWRTFIRNPVQNEVPVIANRSLLCDHGGFVYSPEYIESSNCSRLEYLSNDEWKNLTNYISYDTEIVVTRIVEDDGRVTFAVQPEVCQECAAEREESDLKVRLTYAQATIFVHKLSSDTLASVGLSQATDSQPIQHPEVHSESSDSSMDAKEKNKAVKRKVIKPESNPENEEVAMKVIRSEHGARRCLRLRQHIRGEKAITVSSTMTLRDLKLQIMQLFSVAPYDQHLLLDGQELTGDMNTLASLHVFPQSVIYLKADESVEDPTFLDEVKGGVTEEGFKGTSLLGR